MPLWQPQFVQWWRRHFDQLQQYLVSSPANPKADQQGSPVALGWKAGQAEKSLQRYDPVTPQSHVGVVLAEFEAPVSAQSFDQAASAPVSPRVHHSGPGERDWWSRQGPD